jgi:probable HAF family extracellular repeat protein
VRCAVSDRPPFVRRSSFASSTAWRASPLARRLVLATAALALVACQRDSLTDPTRLAPTTPELVLTGGVGTPIFPMSPAGESQPLGFAIGLNAAGQVTGGVHNLFSGGDEGNKPFRWSRDGSLVKLEGCCENGFGADINATGVVVGSIEAGANASYRAFVATGNSISILPPLPGIPDDAETRESNAQALALNDAGDIVGFSPVSGTSSHAVRWSASGQIVDLGTLGGSRSQAVDINNAGQIIGMSRVSGDGSSHAFLWSTANGMQDLNTLLGATITDVVEINDAGQIVGTYTTPGGHSHAFRYTPGSGLLDLGTLGGTSSAPTGLNGRGEVIGTSTLADGSTHAFLWTPADGMEDITALTGLVDVRRLNDNMQTLTVTAPPTGTPGIGKEIPRLVQLQVTQSNFPPTARFTRTCNGLTCTLDASGSLDDKPGLTYSWDLNKYPGGSATGAVVTVTYPHASTRTVTLTVRDASGLTSTASETFAASEYPFAAFTYSCSGLTCSFDSNGSTNNGDDYTPIWYFSDGEIAYSVPAASHTFAQPGTYTVKLEILSFDAPNAPTVATVVRQVTVTAPAQNQAPIARFTVWCSNLACSFDATSSADDKGIVSYAWDLNKYPGGSATGSTVTATYPHAGTRNVTLTVRDASGLSSSITKSFDPGATVAPTDAPPVARFTYSCNGTVCTLNASTSSDDVGITRYDWSLGKSPGGTASGVTVTTDYWHTGTRTVTLTVTDTKGQTSSVTKTVNVP